MTELRQAPSGPPITNDAGAPLDVGAGLISRLWETHMTANAWIQNGSAQEIRSDMSDPASDRDFRIIIDNPHVGLTYIARVRFDLLAGASYAGATLGGLSLRAIAEGGAELFLNQTNIPIPLAGAPFHVDFESLPFLPSALPTWEPGQSIQVAAELSAMVVDPVDTLAIFSTGQLGTAVIEVQERF